VLVRWISIHKSNSKANWVESCDFLAWYIRRCCCCSHAIIASRHDTIHTPRMHRLTYRPDLRRIQMTRETSN
jgi:hypothetical protein